MGLYQSAMQIAPSGPSLMSMGRKVTRLERIRSGSCSLAKPEPCSVSRKRQTRLARKSLVISVPWASAGRWGPSTTSSPQYFGLPGFMPWRILGVPTAA